MTSQSRGAREARARRRAPEVRETQGLQIEHVPIDRLRPWPGNPRTMSEPEMAKLIRPIDEFGLVEPLVVRRQDDTVIGGHQRLAAMRARGMTHVPVVRVDLSEAQAKALNLALNKIQGEWDLLKLGELLEELRDLPDLGVSLSGSDERETETLPAKLQRQQLPPPWEESHGVAAEMPQVQRQGAPTRVSSGELWRLGRHRLL